MVQGECCAETTRRLARAPGLQGLITPLDLRCSSDGMSTTSKITLASLIIQLAWSGLHHRPLIVLRRFWSGWRLAERRPATTSALSLSPAIFGGES